MKASKLSSIKVWKLAFIFFVAALTGLLSLASCQIQRKPSIILIAVDRLAFNSFACSDDKASSNSGLSTLCFEALRFTHAYTTSLQPAAAVGSLLTGKYPFEHGLHRSYDRLKPEIKTLAEVARQNGYRTAFFSGSPAIMKKTGLARGFDLFDDLSFLEKNNYMTNFKNQSEAALNWISESREDYFMTIYNSELESLKEGETEISSFEKIDENLAGFFSTLKQLNQWESNYIIVAGLQGESDYNRLAETPFSNLHSENTNVTVFIKPPRQKGDEGTHWKIDTPVTLADVGLSLIKTIKDDYLPGPNQLFVHWDLSVLWKKNNTDLNLLNPRKILIETVNPWKKNLESRFAILFKNLLYIENKNDELYNTLNDGLESINISKTANSSQTDFKNENRVLLTKLCDENKFLRWSDYQFENQDWIIANREYWSKPNNRSKILDDEFIRFKNQKKSQPLTTLMIQYYFSKNKFDLLKQLNINHQSKKLSSEKDNLFENARRQSLNLSLENVWGLWNENLTVDQSTLIKEYQ